MVLMLTIRTKFTYMASEMASFFEKKGVKFPRTPLLLSVVLTVLLYWFGGIPGWSAPMIAVIQFLLMGGFRFCKLAYHTLPRA